MTARQRKSQSHRTDQGSSDVGGPSIVRLTTQKSQSHRTDQGSSDCHPSNPLNLNPLK